MGNAKPYAFTTLNTFFNLILTKLKMAFLSCTAEKEGETQKILPVLGINHLIVRFHERIKVRFHGRGWGAEIVGWGPSVGDS